MDKNELLEDENYDYDADIIEEEKVNTKINKYETKLSKVESKIEKCLNKSKKFKNKHKIITIKNVLALGIGAFAGSFFLGVGLISASSASIATALCVASGSFAFVMRNKIKSFVYKRKAKKYTKKYNKLLEKNNNYGKSKTIENEKVTENIDDEIIENNPITKEETNTKEEKKSTIKDLKIMPSLYNAILYEDGTYSMSKEQLKLLNTVLDKDTMSKENISKIREQGKQKVKTYSRAA